MTGHARRSLLLIAALIGSATGQQQNPQQPSTRVPLQQKSVQRRALVQAQEEPVAREAPGIRPSQIPRTQRFLMFNSPIRISAAANAQAFIDWAGASRSQDREPVRSAIAARSGDTAFSQALCAEAFAAKDTDFSRTLLALSVLGEMKNQVGEECLTRFLHLPMPQDGLVVEGENVKQASLGSLQAKAIQGLAYLRTARADQEVLTAVQSHPSPVVRAAAIDAYLWNHGTSPEARTNLQRYARPDEHIFMDRIRREYGEPARSFNIKVDTFIRIHPEIRAIPIQRLQSSEIKNKVATPADTVQRRSATGVAQRQIQQQQIPIQQAPPVR